MDIAAMSMSMIQLTIQTEVSTALMGKVMDAQSQQVDTLLQGFEKANSTPSFGHELDTYA